MSKDFLEYKGYYAKIYFSATDMVLHGKIEGINDLINFEATNVFEIENEFHLAVDDYLLFCEDIGQEPEKAYKGSFNVRMNSELHKAAAIEAFKSDKTLNQLVIDAVKAYISKTKINIENINLALIAKDRQRSITDKNKELWENIDSQITKPNLRLHNRFLMEN